MKAIERIQNCINNLEKRKEELRQEIDSCSKEILIYKNALKWIQEGASEDKIENDVREEKLLKRKIPTWGELCNANFAELNDIMRYFNLTFDTSGYDEDDENYKNYMAIILYIAQKLNIPKK